MLKNEEEPPRSTDESPFPIRVQSYRHVTNGSGVVFWGLCTEEARVVPVASLDGIGGEATFTPPVSDVTVLAMYTPEAEQSLKKAGWAEQPAVQIRNELVEEVA